MITVENFYWVLFENLLKPTGLDCWYHWPWGTRMNLSQKEFDPLINTFNLDHVFFHFDQEPLWCDHLGPYDSEVLAWSSKVCKILANSEQSVLKKNICQSHELLDWYFFYHGFAALDWYRDAKYIQSQHPIKNSFLSLNHLVNNQRSYRLALLARLINEDIAHTGSISFHASLNDVMTEIDDPFTHLSEVSKELIKRNMSKLSTLPWLLDNVPINGDLSARFGHNEHRLWQGSLFHVVNETVFYESKLHLTEKIFKPIVAERPFILTAAPGNLEYLRSYGFKTFDLWIDESYDSLTDPDQRLDAITRELAKLAKMNQSELQNLHSEMLPVLDHNKKHFFGRFREIIVSELVDNFDQCIRIWNNGRVDGRDLTLHPDPKAAKRNLLR